MAWCISWRRNCSKLEIHILSRFDELDHLVRQYFEDAYALDYSTANASYESLDTLGA